MSLRLAAGALMVAAFPLAAQVPPERYERAAQAPSAGWYRVDLDPATRGRMTPDARDLRILDASGREVPYLLLRPPKSAGAVPASALSVREADEGWELVFDLGPSPPRHQAFRFEFANPVSVTGCRLESGKDGASWKPLARGDLFRIGEGAGLSRTSLSYPPTPDRYLRLLWPRGGDYPNVRRAEVLPAPPEPATVLELALPFQPQSDLPGGRVYALALPGSGVGLRRLRLSAVGAGAMAYRLSAPRQGLWKALAEGTLTRDPAGAWPEVNVEEGAAETPTLRFEVASGTLPGPQLTAIWGAFEVEAVLFHAETPGAYRIAYGSLGMAPPDYPSLSLPAAPESLPSLALGPEREVAPPGLPAARAGLGAAMPPAAFAAAWPVEHGVKPGELARLDLPEAVYGAAREDLADLRLESGGHQVPYLLHSPAEPAIAGEWRGLAPTPGRTRGESEILLPETAPDLPLTALELRVAASAFHRPVTVRLSGEGDRPGVEAAAKVTYGDWTCAGASALPCRIVVPLWGAGPRGRLRVVFQDGDNPPLPAVDAVVWRRRHALYFMNTKDPVRLLAGSPGLPAPRYDLASLESQILAMPSQAAALGRAESGGPRTGSRNVWLALVGALILCGAVLLLILARAVKREDG
ncbi:MAG: DUF3999 family protein [Acidobacteriota bacterium]